MKSFGKIMAVAALVVGCTVAAAPKASACGSCGSSVLTQPAVIDSTLVAPQPVVDTTIMQPAVIDESVPVAPVVDSCNTCGATIMRPRHHLLDIGTPFFGFHLF